jgi:hypothetical protein
LVRFNNFFPAEVDNGVMDNAPKRINSKKVFPKINVCLVIKSFVFEFIEAPLLLLGSPCDIHMNIPHGE